MRSCLLITNEYPYGKAEPFLETEIEYLSNEFDKIYIFSITGRENEEPTRKIPLNTKVFSLGGSRSKLRYIVYLLKGVISPSTDLKLGGINKKALLEVYSRGRAKFVEQKIQSIILREKIDVSNAVVYSYWFTYQAIAAWLLSDTLRALGNNVVSVSRAHGYDLYWERNGFSYLPYQDVSIQHLTQVFPCSNNGKKYLEELYPKLVDQHKITCARLGTLDHGLAPEGEEDSIVIATCCFMDPIKRMPLFAKAFCILQKRRKCKWVCIGDGPQKELVEEIIKANNLERNVEFLGSMKNSEVMEYYRTNAISLFCNVSITEGVPVSVMEAMSFGIPIIATDVGGTGELVDNSIGRLIPVDISENQLADIISQEIEYLKVHRSASRKKWAQMASADNNYKAWSRDLISLIDK